MSLRRIQLLCLAAVFGVLGILMLTGCASLDENRRDAYVAGAADCGTTALGLAIGRGIAEANPIGPIAACAVKPFAVEYAASQPEPQRTSSLHSVEAVWKGLAANNLAATLFALTNAGLPWTAPVVIGIAVAVYQWQQGEDERIYAAFCAEWTAQRPGNYCEPFKAP